MRKLLILVMAFVLFDSPAIGLAGAAAADLLTGVNVPNPMRASEPSRNALIGQLKSSGVHVVRFALRPDDKDLEFAKNLYAQGIKIDLIVDPQYAPNAPTRPADPAFPNMYSGHYLSAADPDISKNYFQSLLAKLEARGVVLAGLELGNEINWSAFNGEFPIPGEGKIFSLDDLEHDSEGQRIANGYLQYLKILGVLKAVRDHSTLNQKTPIISAGLSNTGRARTTPGAKLDGASISATLVFMRAHGLDKLVDAYGIHYYPWNKDAAGRKANLENNAVAECHPANSGAGKPCWITEWGVENRGASCPLDESSRLPIVREMMDDFIELAQQRKVVAILYYDWTGDPWAKNIDPNSIFRCGALTNAGKLTLSPM
jgi:hypothetical protein